MPTAKPKKKFLSGFCGNGQHEGERPRNYRGVPLPTCKFWDTCRCECHERITKMFVEAGLDRVLMDNPEYRPEPNPFVMPDRPDTRPVDVPFDTGGVPVPDTDAEPVNGAHVAAHDGSPRRSSSGRMARGGLEEQVFLVCRAWADKELDWDLCTPKQIAEYIWQQETSKPTPSTGAIQAVWDRWAKLGFATYAKKPVRFVGFANEDATYEELENKKLKAKRDKKRTKSAMARGMR